MNDVASIFPSHQLPNFARGGIVDMFNSVVAPRHNAFLEGINYGADLEQKMQDAVERNEEDLVKLFESVPDRRVPPPPLAAIAMGGEQRGNYASQTPMQPPTNMTLPGNSTRIRSSDGKKVLVNVRGKGKMWVTDRGDKVPENLVPAQEDFAPINVKFSNYGYVGDSTPDSYSEAGVGHDTNLLVDGLSAAVSAPLAKQLGIKSGDFFEVKTPEGNFTFRHDDTVPNDFKGGKLPPTIDAYRASNGRNNFLSRVTGIRKLHEKPN